MIYLKQKDVRLYADNEYKMMGALKPLFESNEKLEAFVNLCSSFMIIEDYST